MQKHLQVELQIKKKSLALIITNAPPFCFHGLNALYLNRFGWYRVDPRGNKKGVSTEFCPPVEKLAFPIVTQGEADLPEIWAEPLLFVTSIFIDLMLVVDTASFGLMYRRPFAVTVIFAIVRNLMPSFGFRVLALKVFQK